MDPVLAALSVLSDPFTVLAILAGSVIGIVFGSVPGLTFSMALAIVLPLTFRFETGAAIGMLIGTYIGGMTGGSVSGILLGIPGTPSAAATVADGHAMARKGHAGLALGGAVLASGFGGIFSLLVMMASVDLIARIAIRFGPVEIFALVLFGMSTICGLSGKSLIRGLIAGVIGLLLMTIGLDEVDGVARMNFGWTPLLQGVNLLVAMVGLFAIPMIIQTFVEHRDRTAVRLESKDIRSELPSLRKLARNFWLMCRCSALGTGIGAIPGTGGPIAAFLAYDHAKRFSKDKSKFGKGAFEGVVAPESANNAVTGGAMIPLLSLGIPGDPATAIILGGFLIHGLVPGPMLFQHGKADVYLVYMAILVAYVSVVAFQFLGVRAFAKLLRVPPHLMAVGVLIMCGLGAFAIRNSFLDIYLMTGVGLLGYLLLKARVPITPIILGLVLGPTLEREFRTALILSEGDYSIFFSSGTAIIFYLMAAGVIGMHALRQYKDLRSRTAEGPDGGDKFLS